ncbi:MAG: SDR family NAD(P)-dependent oxidoreductase, partial [Coprobacter sp.]|nr:SDR family NAD(P)-dependent oxidoreductase [Coprobacter sp.]
MESNGYIVVTGANGGMGASLTESLVRRGCGVVMACRNTAKAEEVRRRIVAACPAADVRLYGLDLASFDSVRSFTRQLQTDGLRVSALVNNAGVMNRDFALTADGYEQNIGINYIGTYLLTRRMIPLLERGGCIVNTGSLTYRIGRVNEAMFVPDASRYTRFGSYGVSKQAVVLFTLELAERLRESGLRVYAVDPGVVDTGIITMHRWFDPVVDGVFRPVIRTPQEGAERTLALLTGRAADFAPTVYWGRRRPVK